ncbi:MAG: dihydropteroate synthase, partial [Prevotella sp.]|nr:dihydropteroate synthase [Prevotella sp.]
MMTAPYTLNVKGRLLALTPPRVMGILNVTPDSFFADSRMQTRQAIAQRVRQIVAEGGTIIDVGACSTRPNAQLVSEQEEMERLRKALPIVSKEISEFSEHSEHSEHSESSEFSEFSERSESSEPSQLSSPLPLSIDTFRPDVARMAVEEFGADLINDVSGGSEAMFRMAARLGKPYILTSVEPDLRSTLLTCAAKVQQLRDFGQKDIILDPGFGFGKTLQQNFAILNELEKLHVLELPIMVGFSRKSMICRTLGCTPDEALGGTTVLNTIALMKGAAILRVHDVKAAAECIALTSHLSPLTSPHTP